MNLRTTFSIDPSPYKISYLTPSMFVGSCFASEIGKQMENGRLPVLINPAGTVYNPVSVANTLEFIISKKKFTEKNLYKNKDQYISFYHYKDFSSEDRDKCLLRINDMTEKAHEFLSTARFLFITFGTARIFKFKETGEVVSNCHKLPPDFFSRELLSVEDIVTRWEKTLDKLQKFNNQLNIIFTVSPVRHWKDGAHGNQVSKSVLMLAIEEMLKHQAVKGYFPAYEMIMDDLRDYRFYADDMLHPSTKAIEYIWKAFTDCYIDNQSMSIWREVSKIIKAYNHRLTSESPGVIRVFAEKILEIISMVTVKVPFVDLKREKDYFQDLLKILLA